MKRGERMYKSSLATYMQSKKSGCRTQYHGFGNVLAHYSMLAKLGDTI